MAFTFEDKFEDINRELEKKRFKWTLKATPHIDYDDVKQLITTHIWKKFYMWDQSKDFIPWVNVIINHQTINLLRNLYLNIASPCVNCPANEGDGRCRIYGTQNSECKLYKKWEKGRKNAYNVRLPVSIENHAQESYEKAECDLNIETVAENLHPYMKEVLTPVQYKVYNYLFIENKTEEEVAELMNYISNEGNNRGKGYKQVFNMKKAIIEKAKKVIAKHIY